ncbi:hypothetical protein AB205_0203630 [Aquarana catesbeiana]|uniref:Uncharacterized protein n=1 Tax=Aquarana catesbeiana TaxID=8400 RepID=A0A2G9RAF5_AQUCT|nr:hypothetical protein AB205_0203630 [Aquarana catesbeiana]
MPYNHQHKYFFLIGPPSLLPLYFQWYIFYFVVQRKKWVDLAWMISFYVRFAYCYFPLIGIGGTISMFMLVSLFPTMPRHNYWKVAPLIRSLCKKYGIEYQSKPLFTAFADIVHSLKESGELWLDAYLHK